MKIRFGIPLVEPPMVVKEEEGIPGFEFAFLIIAIASIIFLKRRNKEN